MVEAETSGGFMEIGLGTAKVISCPGVPKTEGLELERHIGEILAIKVVEISGIVRAKFGNAPRDIEVGSVASGGSCKIAIQSPLPG